MGYILNRFQRWNNVLTLEFLSFKTQNIVFREENSQISPLTSAEVIYLTRKPVWERQRRAEQGGWGWCRPCHWIIMHCTHCHYPPYTLCTAAAPPSMRSTKYTRIMHCRPLSPFVLHCVSSQLIVLDLLLPVLSTVDSFQIAVLSANTHYRSYIQL